MPGARSADALIGLAGTVSTLASIDLGLATYQRDAVHHHRMPAGRILDRCHEIAHLTVEERRVVVGMEAARAEVIVGGLVVLEAVVVATGADELLVSESDILDGMAARLLR